MILINRRVLVQIARFCNDKRLLGKSRIRVHKNISKRVILEDMSRYFKIISLSRSFRLIPLSYLQPVLPEIALYQESPNIFFLNNIPYSNLHEYSPIFFS